MCRRKQNLDEYAKMVYAAFVGSVFHFRPHCCEDYTLWAHTIDLYLLLRNVDSMFDT